MSRYPDGGGLTAAARTKREQVRLEAADLFEQGVPPTAVARRLRVTRTTACRWHRTWRAGGRAALASKGPGGSKCRLTAAQLELLKAELERGPLAHGWDDQCWTLARIAAVIKQRFGVTYTVRGTSYLLHRIGWSPQVPRRRAVERDEAAIAAWREQTWPRIKAQPGATARGSASSTSPARV
jgi:transposase